MPFVPFPRRALNSTIHAQFLRQVEASGNARAVVGADASYTYRELAERSSTIARGIRSCSAESGPLPLLIEQGAELVAAIVGTLLAERPYVPLDPTTPDAELEVILADLDARIVLTDRANAGRVRSLGIDVSLIDAVASGAPVGAPHPPSTSDELAYIYYTSGTTGAPKGVTDTHRNVLHNISRYVNGLDISSEDRLTLLQGPGFSGAVSNIFSALLTGACVYPYDVPRQGLASVADWLAANRITIYHSVPSIFRQALEGAPSLPALRLIRLEGDRATPRDIELFQRHFGPGCTLVNGLGATECGIVRRLFVEVDDDERSMAASVPIGYAVEDMDVCVENERGEQVPDGEVGEIVVRSRYLSPGYWRRPELTAARFSEHDCDDGVRAYRTGDSGRMHSDGCLEYLGRMGTELRVHGRQIDSDHVVRALRRSRLVTDALLAVRERPGGRPTLVGYVVPAPECVATVVDYHRALEGAVPPHAVPGRWVSLTSLPLTRNGKLDTDALPEPAWSQRTPEMSHVAPRSDRERQLVELWQTVLELTEVGIDDRFTELGGDSLHAAIICGQIETTAVERVPADMLLRAPTVRLLAQELETLRAERTRSALFSEHGEDVPFVLLHGDYEGGGVYAGTLAESLGPSHPTLVLGPHQPGQPGQPATVREMAEEFCAKVRSTFEPGPLVIAGYAHAGGIVAFELARRLQDAGYDVNRLVLIATVAPHPIVRALRAPVACLARVLSLSPEQEQRVMLASRAVASRVGHLVGALKSWQPVEEDASDASWRHAVAGYAPRRAPELAVTLLWCADDPSPDPTDPGGRWRALCGNLTTRTVEGTFDRVVVDHLDAIERTIRDELRAAGLDLTPDAPTCASASDASIAA